MWTKIADFIGSMMTLALVVLGLIFISLLGVAFIFIDYFLFWGIIGLLFLWFIWFLIWAAITEWRDSN